VNDEEEEEEEDEDAADDGNKNGAYNPDDMDEMDMDERVATPMTPRTPGGRSRLNRVQSQQKLLESSGATSRGTKAPTNETRVRGCVDPRENVSKPMHYISTFGDDDRDLLAVIFTRDRWARGVDTCLPTRHTLEIQSTANDYEYGPTWGVAPEEIEKERTSGWDWYYDKVIGAELRKAQSNGPKLKEMDARRKYLPKAKKGKHTILMGPVDDQKVFHLGHHESLNFDLAWGDTKAQKSDRASTKVREGWLISFGQKIQCLAWAPNQDGISQYLAVVTLITPEQKEKHTSHGSEPFSPFRPAPSYPCALQLWEFKGKQAGPVTRTLDMETKPLLRLVLCTDWGDIRRIAWCPMAREKREEDDQNGIKTIGLLAGIWGDGKIRVLDVKLDPGKKTEFGKCGWRFQ
jgi:transcription factor C subunit 6